MTENKPIINIIFNNLNQRIKNIGEKCLNFQEENKNLKEQLARKTQECEKKSWEIDNLGYKIKNQRKEINERLKQLKAKEQECEELKKHLIKCDDNIIVDCKYSKKDLCSFIHRKKDVINGLQEQLDQLKAENEEYKEEIMLLRKGYDEEDCTKTCPNMQIYERELKQAEQKLEKIRNFMLYEFSGKNEWVKKQILQIIDEVE